VLSINYRKKKNKKNVIIFDSKIYKCLLVKYLIVNKVINLAKKRHFFSEFELFLLEKTGKYNNNLFKETCFDVE
jgi:hypothetical protein